jgi:hypothetical protein
MLMVARAMTMATPIVAKNSTVCITITQIKTRPSVLVEMEAIEAVLELAKERDELVNDLETYENWFESLVGKRVTLTVPHKKKVTRFVECTVTDFNHGEGWELTSTDSDDEVFMVTFDDFIHGHITVHKE